MNLIIEKWTSKDGQAFQVFLEGLKREEKIDWTRKILNTNFPLLALTTKQCKDIAKQISKGNFLSFLDLNLHTFYENMAINGFLIDEIKDFSVMKKYLDIFVEYVDTWACCDLLKFKIISKNKEKFFSLSRECIKSNIPFKRRIGVNIWFKFFDDEKYIVKIFDLINSLKSETHYYVNMAVAWWVAECFVKRRDVAIKLFEEDRLNTFTNNKSIQKCRDSFRVSEEDKNMLLKFKK